MFDYNLSQITTNNLKKEAMEDSKVFREDVNYNAFYSALVVDTNDSYSLGRIRIRIPALHGVRPTEAIYLKDDELPWARPGVFNAGGNDMGQFIIPEKGSSVFVTFEYNDPSKPIYFGGIPTLIGANKNYNDNPDIYYGQNVIITDNDKIKDLENNKAKQIVYKSFKGATVEINDKDGQESIKIISADGQVLEMGVDNPDGHPLERRGNKIGSNNPNRFIRLKSSDKEYIEIVPRKNSCISKRCKDRWF